MAKKARGRRKPNTIVANWAKCTTTTSGTGNVTLSTVSGFPSFSDVFTVGQIIS